MAPPGQAPVADTLGWIAPDALAELRGQFFEECSEHLVCFETGLARLIEDGSEREVLNTVFRAVHSIKGGAAVFGMAALVSFAHAMEAVLAALRGRPEAPKVATLRILLQAADRLEELIAATRDDAALPDAALAPVLHALQGALPGTADAPAFGHEQPVAPAGGPDEIGGFDFIALPISLDEPAPPGVWTITFRPTADLYRKANEPRLVLEELARLGTMLATIDDAALPLLDGLDTQAGYLAWTIRLTTSSGEAAIRDVFAFVEGDCDLAIVAAQKPQAAPPSAPLGQTAAAPGGAIAAGTTIRVDTDRVDRLVNLVSELVIGETTLVETIANSAAARESSMAGALDGLRQLTRELQEAVMAIRAQPVRSVFQRMARLVRQTEAATGKMVRLVTEGEDTEVDRAVLERLADPLTHMVRNAIDHGVELPAKRAQAGKPEAGTVRISAAHRAGRIVIQVNDDGNGIDRARVRAIAAQRGLIAADAVLNDEESDNLIFEPGFSTADTVSDLSGRGVGMDVVRRGVQALGGRIAVTSRPGAGTSFALSLPLTLAVLDGMLVTVCGQILVAPLTALLETVQPSPDRLRRLGATGTLLAIRGRHVPLVDLGAALGFRAGGGAPPAGVALLVEDETGEQVALLADTIIGQRQVVIKSLEAHYRRVRGIAAATILGDGRVALILDINGMIATHRSHAALRAPQPVAAFV